MSENNPLPIDSSIYTSQWCDEMGGQGSNELFVKSRGEIIRPRLAYALELASLEQGLRILDIGCGRGEVIIKALQAGASLAVGLDYAAVPIESSRQNLKKFDLWENHIKSGVGLVRSDAKSLPFADRSFDRIFMLDIVEHLFEWELQEVWSEVKRVLAPDGYLIVHTLPNRWAVDIGYRVARSFVPSLPEDAGDKRDIFHINEQTPGMLLKSLRKTGLDHHVWLKDQMIRQADWWLETKVRGEEAQTKIYQKIQKPFWRGLWKLVAVLPTRLFFVTDLFAVAWKDKKPTVVNKLPNAWSERYSALFTRL